MNKNLRKNKIILPIVIILTLVVLIGGTYAIFARVDEANIANNYKTGNLHIVIDDTSEGLGGNLNLTTIPLSDEEGSALEPYKFKVINKGNLYYVYNLKMLKDMITTETDSCIEKQIPTNYIKVKINDEQPILLSDLEESKFVFYEAISPSKERYYELRIWLDESAPNSVIGSHFHGKVTIDGYAVHKNEMITNFEYTGDYQKFTAKYDGEYKIELWGATGDSSINKGGYTKGNIVLKKDEKMYVYVGQKGEYTLGGYNGGGIGRNVNTSGYKYGGGATDIRYFGGYEPTEDEMRWNSTLGLRSRIMVAAGSGGGSMGEAGGLSGYVAYDSGYIDNKSNGGSQTAGGTVSNYSNSYAAGTNGSFGIGGNGGGGRDSGSGGKGGGGGYYGGAGASRTYGGSWPGGGGSSFISGHTGCVAITSSGSTNARTGTNGVSCTTGTADNLCSIHYSGKYFTDTLMIDGAGYTWTNVKASTVGTNLMPNPLGDYYASGVGHSGNGYARITFVG